MEDRHFQLAGGGLMVLAAGVVLASLQAEQVSVLGSTVPTLVLAAVLYLLGVLVTSPVHVRAGNARRLGGNLMVGVGVVLFAWAATGGSRLASAVGLVFLLAAAGLLFLEGRGADESVDED